MVKPMKSGMKSTRFIVWCFRGAFIQIYEVKKVVSVFPKNIAEL